MSEPALPGALLFARYAYPPNALGLCGADAPGVLLEYGDANESDRGLAELARTFEGAWPYLTLIAGANGIDDPLDPHVVEAYWVGNELLGRVDRSALARHVEDRFRGRIGRSSERLLETVHAGTVPHHNFHVFAVYPWFGLLRTGIVEEPLHVLDSCRITPAVVESTAGDNARVRLRPLNWDGTSLELGGWEQREVRWRETGRAFAVPVPGDWVSVHWDFVCDRLTPAAALALDRATRQAMRAVNASSAAAAALA